jgi:hypothetical protein
MEGIEGWCTEASQSASRPWQVGSSVASDERLVPLDSPAVGCPLTRFHPAPPAGAPRCAGYTSLLATTILHYVFTHHGRLYLANLCQSPCHMEQLSGLVPHTHTITVVVLTRSFTCRLPSRHEPEIIKSRIIHLNKRGASGARLFIFLFRIGRSNWKSNIRQP